MKTITLVYFSPTKTTRTILETAANALAERLGLANNAVRTIDVTRPAHRMSACPQFDDSDIVLLGAPVYAGRLPEDAAEFFKTIKATGTPAALTVLYGNREFEDALLELKDISQDCGFIPVAGSAFIGEHSFSSDDIPIAGSRPDKNDLKKAVLFGEKIAALVENEEHIANIGPLDVPGNFPYKEGMGKGAFEFVQVTADCDNCGTCVTVCPKDAVDEINGYTTVDIRCIFCCACIKACPNQARQIKEGPMRDKARWLNENCSEHKQPETFFAPVI
ncbi:MAG: 4Fe-4S binding protein [Desulfobacterales bacterium]|nr:4Fe-4S binding protein [Desulfobacterales bacterium]